MARGNHDHHVVHHQSVQPIQRPARRLDRRTILKATAAFLAAATVVDPPAPAPRATATDFSTRANLWTQPDAIVAGDWVTFEADFGFNAIAPHWPGASAIDIVVEVQLSADDASWTNPVVIGPAHIDAGPPDRDGRIYGELLFAEHATTVRYRTLDLDGNGIFVPDLQFTYIDARNGPTIEDILDGSINAKAGPRLINGSQTRLRPPIISRQEWGADQAYGGADKGTDWWTPSYQRVQHVIVHHSVTPQFRNPLIEIRSIHYYHAVTRGWGDIGYNYLVDFMGNVYEGRAGGENVVGGHAFEYAWGSAGICTMGTFASISATPEAIAGLTWITAWAARNLDPLGRSDFHTTPNLPTICGHRDVVESTCPGDGVYADLPTIRRGVSDILRGVRRVLQDPEFSPGQTVRITVDGANMRAKPGTGQSSVASLSRGAIMHVTNGPTTTSGYTWYELTGNRGTGWVASTLFAASNAEPPIGKYAVGDSLEVIADALNIRSQPTTGSSLVAMVRRGAKGKVVGGPYPAGGYRWYQLDTSSGRGWAVEQYLARAGQAPAPSRFAIGDFVAVTERDGLRLRADAGIGSSLIRTLPYGTSATIVGRPKVVDGLAWIEISTSTGSGWVAEQYLTPSSSGPESTAKFSRGNRVRVDADLLNMRQGAGADQPVLRRLGNGIVGTVLSAPSFANGLWWVQIETTYGTGWVAETFLVSASADTVGLLAVGDRIEVDASALNIRTAPGASNPILTILKNGDEGKVIDGPRNSDGFVWYKIESTINTGWAAGSYLSRRSTPGGNATIWPGDLVTISTGVKLREQPGLNGRWLSTLNPGDTALVIGAATVADGYTWLQLRSGSREGWGVALYLARTGKASIVAGQKARVSNAELNLRSGAGTSYGVISILPDGAYVDVIEQPRTINGIEWVRVTSSRYGTGWCATNYLIRA